MANVEHKNIVDPNVHEPKGISTAPSGTAYLANGSGSGSWQTVLTASTIPATVGTGSFSATKYLDNVSSGIFVSYPTFHSGYNAGNLYAPNSNGFFGVTKSGIYHVSFRHTITIDVAVGGQEVSISIKPVREIADNPLQVVQFPNFSANNIVTSTDVYGNITSKGSSSPIVTTSSWFHGTTVVRAGEGIGFWAIGTFKASESGSPTNIIRYTSVTTEITLTRLGDV